MKIALDIDGVVVSEYSKLFSILTSAFQKNNDIEIFIISSREKSNKSKKETIQELKELGIFFDYLILTDNKQKVIKENSIDLFIENEIENLQGIDSGVCCLLIREQMNYCWKSERFLGNKKTVKMLD